MEITNSFTVDEPIEKAWELLTDIPFIAPCLPGAKLTDEVDGVYSGGIKIKVGPVTAEYKGSAEFVEKDETTYKAVINGKGRDTRGAGNAQALITAQMVPVGTATQVDIITDLKISGKVAQFGRGVMQDVSSKLLGQFAECLETKIAETKAALAEPVPATTITAPADATVQDAVADAAAPAAPAAATGVAAAAAGTAAAATATGTAATAAGTAATTTDATPASAPAPAPTPTSTFSPSSSSDDDDVLDLGDIGVGSALAKRAAPAAGVFALLLILRWLFGRNGSSSE